MGPSSGGLKEGDYVRLRGFSDSAGREPIVKLISWRNDTLTNCWDVESVRTQELFTAREFFMGPSLPEMVVLAEMVKD